MPLYNYFKKYNIIVSEYKSTGFPPPWHQERVWTLGQEIDGWYQEGSSTEERIALAQGIKTIGQFWTYPFIELHDQDIVFEQGTGFYIRIIGDQLAKISQFADFPHKRFNAQVVDRTELDT